MTKPVHVPPYPTQEQVDTLPHGTRIVVTWPNGNGPWDYTIYKSFGRTMVARNASLGIDYLDFVGDKKPHTLVTIAVP